MNRMLFIAVVALSLLAGCVVVAPDHHRNGPPSHAPAHGYRHHYRYYYYPDAAVYFDLDRNLYFYMDGGWKSAARLPRHMRARLYDPVSLTMDQDRPYVRYKEHRKTYPSSRSKHRDRKRDRYHEDDRW